VRVHAIDATEVCEWLKGRAEWGQWVGPKSVGRSAPRRRQDPAEESFGLGALEIGTRRAFLEERAHDVRDASSGSRSAEGGIHS
jgi:hypothetical protein